MIKFIYKNKNLSISVFCNRIILLLFFVPHILYSQSKPEYSTKNKKAISNYEKGLKMFESGNDPEAIKLISKSISEDDQFVEAHALLGTIYAVTEDFANSAKEYQKV